jgi:hypothetical protein
MHSASVYLMWLRPTGHIFFLLVPSTPSAYSLPCTEASSVARTFRFLAKQRMHEIIRHQRKPPSRAVSQAEVQRKGWWRNPLLHSAVPANCAVSAFGGLSWGEMALIWFLLCHGFLRMGA